MMVIVMETDDNILVEQCRGGNIGKFQVLVERYKKQMYPTQRVGRFGTSVGANRFIKSRLEVRFCC
jgi:hypothetical protein